MFSLKCSRWFIPFFLAFGLLVACNNGNNGSTDTDESVPEVVPTAVVFEENTESGDAEVEKVEEVDALTFLDEGETDLVEETIPAADEIAEEAIVEDVVNYPVTITNTTQVTMTWGVEILVVIFDEEDEGGNWFAVIDGDQSITETVVVDYTFENLAVAYLVPAEEWGTNEGLDGLWACALQAVRGDDFIICLNNVELPEAEEIDPAVDENTAEGDEPEAVCQFEGSQAAFILISEGTQGSTNYVYTDPFWGDITIDSDHPVTMEEATMEDGCLKTGFSIPHFSGPMSLHVLASDGSDLPLYSFHNPTSQDGLGTDGHAFTAP